MQNKAIRYFVGLGPKTPILALQGEMGWMSPSSRHFIKIIKLWNRIIKMEHSRLPFKLIQHMLNRNIGWVNQIRIQLKNINLDHIVNDQTYIPVSVAENKIADNEQLEWKNGLTSKPKLRTYVQFKLLYITEFYVTALLPKNKRSLLSQFRCGVLPLATETGRYKQVPRHERYCSMCKTNSVEDEIHFLCHCNFYKVLRDVYL